MFASSRHAPYIRGMRRQGGGFGFVILLVVVAIVLWLAAKNWQSTLPAAAEISKPGRPASTLDTPPNSGESVPARPNLSDMKNATDAHTSDVNRSLDQQ